MCKYFDYDEYFNDYYKNGKIVADKDFSINAKPCCSDLWQSTCLLKDILIWESKLAKCFEWIDWTYVAVFLRHWHYLFRTNIIPILCTNNKLYSFAYVFFFGKYPFTNQAATLGQQIFFISIAKSASCYAHYQLSIEQLPYF